MYSIKPEYFVTHEIRRKLSYLQGHKKETYLPDLGIFSKGSVVITLYRMRSTHIPAHRCPNSLVSAAYGSCFLLAPRSPRVRHKGCQHTHTLVPPPSSTPCHLHSLQHGVSAVTANHTDLDTQTRECWLPLSKPPSLRGKRVHKFFCKARKTCFMPLATCLFWTVRTVLSRLLKMLL